MFSAVTLLVVFSLSYTFSVFLVSRRRRARLPLPSDDLYFVFLLPCLNEELVIGRTLESLLDLPGENYAVMVIDDGSDDRTAEIVRTFDPERVWLFQRTAPKAREGKGEALNAAYRHLLDSGLLGDRKTEDVVVAILDADGRISKNALFAVAPYFTNPKTGAVQIGVRMYNKTANLLARLQDMEFVTFTEIFQRGREKFGSVGLGGNGQFTRLSALTSLGHAPWTDCLTEDLDLGIRLLCRGWTNSFCPTSHVSQQAVVEFRRLLRQRARWFQGHMQCWKRMKNVIASEELKDRSVYDLLYHLSSPALVLLMTFPMIIFTLTLISVIAADPGEFVRQITRGGGFLFLFWYLLSFGVAPLYGFVYWLRDEETSLVKAIGIAHLFNVYSYMWFIAGWMAVWNIARGRKGWAKTARTPEVESDPPLVPAGERPAA